LRAIFAAILVSLICVICVFFALYTNNANDVTTGLWGGGAGDFALPFFSVAIERYNDNYPKLKNESPRKRKNPRLAS
jgi:hypothetical protein